MQLHHGIIKFGAVGFDWDHWNISKILLKHRIWPLQIEEFFRGSFWFDEDRLHSQLERRYLAIGRPSARRAMVVVFTFRDKDGLKLLRPITARYMHKKELEKYEQAYPQIQVR